MSGSLLTTKQAADLLSLEVRTLHDWRHRGRGPKFVKLGRAVRYRRQDLMDYIEARVTDSTADFGRYGARQKEVA